MINKKNLSFFLIILVVSNKITFSSQMTRHSQLDKKNLIVKIQQLRHVLGSHVYKDITCLEQMTEENLCAIIHNLKIAQKISYQDQL